MCIYKMSTLKKHPLQKYPTNIIKSQTSQLNSVFGNGYLGIPGALHELWMSWSLELRGVTC